MTRLAMIVGLLLSLSLSLSACAHDSKYPYPHWYVGLVAPRYMEVWVESVDVLDQRGYAFKRVHGGVPGYTRKPEGWHEGGGSKKPVNSFDLPEIIFLRWQSLAESQTYRVRIPIPQSVRDDMLKPHRVYCAPIQEFRTQYEDTINLGMAPGGIVKVWMGGACLGYREIGRFQAEVDPRGPYQGKSNGRYIPIEPENKAYIDKHGIPYGTW